MITDYQIRMAKGALKLSNNDLSKLTMLHKNTINNAENGKANKATFLLLQKTFEEHGITFIDDNGVIINER